MHKAEVAALQEYEDALTEFLTSVRARDGRSDFPLRQRLYAAGIQIERLKLRAPQRTMTRFCAPIEIHGRVECKKPPFVCFASSGFVVLDGQGLSEGSCECYQLVRSRLTFHLPKTYG